MADYKQNPHGDGWLVRYDDGTSEVVATETDAQSAVSQVQLEAKMANRKSDFVSEILSLITELAELDDLQQVYEHRGYNTGGADPISEDDLSEAGISLADWNDGLAFILAVKVVVDDSQSIVSKLRTDI